MISLSTNTTAAENHFQVVKEVLKKRIKNILKKGSIVVKGQSIGLSPPLRAYLSYILADNELKQLITSEAEQLEGIISFVKNSYSSFLDTSNPDNIILTNIFITSCYERALDKNEFVKNIPLDTCPYCNRNYIYHLSKLGKIKPQIDHFYPKSKYPFLGVSFYNLIPSCQTCNGFDAKGEDDPIDSGVVNPYMTDFPVFKFMYRINSINVFNAIQDKSSVSLSFKNCPVGYKNMFKLDKLYEQHSDHVIELIIKSKLEYSKKYREYLNSAYNNLTFSDDEINRLIIGNFTQQSDIHKRPLAKLYQDIADDLGLLK
jgi:hypothetical protein